MGRAQGGRTAANILKRGRRAVASPAVLVDDGRGLPLFASGATEQQVEAFGGGFCHAFALELHKRHGWELRCLGQPADEYSSDPWNGLSHTPRHVYCLREDGRPVDVHGVFTNEAAICRYHAHQHDHDEQLVSTPITEQDIRETLPERGYRHINEHDEQMTARHADRLALHLLGR